jgi:outer membrane protein OmpA-like peptidoglycan-associated protein
MNETPRGGHAHAPRVGWLSLLLAAGGLGAVWADPPATVVDSQRIIDSLQTTTPPAPSSSMTRGLVVAERPSAVESHKIALDIRFANDSDRLTDAAHGQLTELGTALASSQLAHARFLIAGYTSVTGAADHNQHLSESRAQAVRGYLVEHFHIEPERLATVGYGAAHPLPDFPPSALEQRRVEISTLPAKF